MSNEVHLNQPVRDLSHLSDALRRVVEEPWRRRCVINRPAKNPPKVDRGPRR